MSSSDRAEQLERRLEQSRRLFKNSNDPATSERIGKLIGALEDERRIENEK